MNMPYNPVNPLESLDSRSDQEQDYDISTGLTGSDKPRLIIIGGGFAGLHLAKSLKGVSLQIVMLDRNNFHTFQPLLYQVATAMLEPDSVANSFRRIFQDQDNFHFRMVEVERIDPEKKVVYSSAGSLEYDFLVIATGARTNFYGMQDIAEHAFVMKDVSQAIAIRQRIFKNFERALMTDDKAEQEALMNIILVGAGPTGIEIAGAIGELKRFILPYDYRELDLGRMRIHMIEAADRVVSAMSPRASRLARQALEKFSVTLWLNTTITAYDGRTAVTSDGDTINSRLLVWVAGVTGNIPKGITRPESLAGGRLKVDAFNKVAGYDGIYALGDVAAMITDDTPRGHPMLAPVAIQQAGNLGRNLALAVKGGWGKPAAFQYRNHGIMATIGRNRAIVQWGRFSFGGFAAWVTWVFVHLMTLVGFRNKLVALVNWAWNYVSFDRSIRLIIPSFQDRAGGRKPPL